MKKCDLERTQIKKKKATSDHRTKINSNKNVTQKDKNFKIWNQVSVNDSPSVSSYPV